MQHSYIQEKKKNKPTKNFPKRSVPKAKEAIKTILKKKNKNKNKNQIKNHPTVPNTACV